MIRVPVTINLQLDHVVGFMELNDDYAKLLANLYANNIKMELSGGVLRTVEHNTLVMVAITPAIAAPYSQ